VLQNLVKFKIREKANVGGGEDKNFNLEGGFSSRLGDQEPLQGCKKVEARTTTINLLQMSTRHQVQQPVQAAQPQSNNMGTVITSWVVRRPNKDANSNEMK
jgi:hypothetical protein